MTTPIIETNQLTKRYGKTVAVDGLSLNVPRATIFGLLGPNGSGKTTLMNILLGLVRPTSGNFRLNNQGKTGALIETPAFYPYLSGEQNLRYFQGISGQEDQREVQDLLEQTGLADRKKDKFQNYSLGMKQRLGIAHALLGNPDLLILDEPTNAMDPAGVTEVRELIKNLGTEGRTLLLSTHLLHEVELVCDSVAILRQGRLIAQGSVDELTNPQGNILLRTTDDAKALQVLRSLSWTGNIEVQDGYLSVEAPPERSWELSEALAQQQTYISEMKPAQNSLEKYFLEVTGDNA